MASTSVVKVVRVPVNEILRQAGWAVAGTFARYYNKTVQKETFAATVLGVCPRELGVLCLDCN